VSMLSVKDSVLISPKKSVDSSSIIQKISQKEIIGDKGEEKMTSSNRRRLINDEKMPVSQINNLKKS
jgi:hypothetical protein